MAYVPAQCESFIPFRPGWICCGCGHFNAMKKTACWRCNHPRCPTLLEPAGFDRRTEVAKKRGRKKIAR